MGQKLLVGGVIAVFALISYFCGLIIGFNNGIQYQEEKTKERFEKYLPITEVENPRIEIEMD